MYDVPEDREEFAGCLAGNLRAATRLVTRLYDEALRDSGLRITQVALLVQVRRLEPITVSRLAEVLSSERSAVARDLRILEREGLVDMRVSGSDRRAREVRLTPAGGARLAAAAPGWRHAQAEMSARLGLDDAAALLAGTRQLVGRFDAASSIALPSVNHSQEGS
jgi:DNA-binding MarR family transcriptional regulator